jgi:hypothetical protein
MKAIIAGALMALSVTAAWAEDVSSANYVMPGCKYAVDPSPARAVPGIVAIGGFCLGQVSAIAALGGAGVLMIRMCIPEGVTYVQMAGVTIRYIEARPQEMHEPFTGLAMAALADAWPCRNSR